MILINKLLGISGQGGAYPALVLNSEGQGIPMYTPVIVEKDVGYVRGTIYFPTGEGHLHRNYILIAKNESLLPLKPKGIIQDRRVKIIDEFEYKKVGKIQEFVRGDGAITFIIEDPAAAMEFIKNLGYFKKEFPCTSFCGGNSPGGSRNPPTVGDSLSLVITMYDLKYAIPVFNKKKADGMAITITLMWAKTNELVSSIAYVNEICFIVNSYPDNVLFVDGTKIRDKSFMNNACISLFLSQINDEVVRQSNRLSKDKKQKSIQSM